MLDLGEIRQHIACNAVFMSGMTNTKADTVEVRSAAKFIDRAQAIMSRKPAACLNADLAGGEVKFVVKHGEVTQP